MISNPPAIVLVAVVLVAMKFPNVGVDVATICPEAFVDSRELTAVPVYVSVLVNLFRPENVLLSANSVDEANVQVVVENE